MFALKKNNITTLVCFIFYYFFIAIFIKNKTKYKCYSVIQKPVIKLWYCFYGFYFNAKVYCL